MKILVTLTALVATTTAFAIWFPPDRREHPDGVEVKEEPNAVELITGLAAWTGAATAVWGTTFHQGTFST